MHKRNAPVSRTTAQSAMTQPSWKKTQETRLFGWKPRQRAKPGKRATTMALGARGRDAASGGGPTSALPREIGSAIFGAGPLGISLMRRIAPSFGYYSPAGRQTARVSESGLSAVWLFPTS